MNSCSIRSPGLHLSLALLSLLFATGVPSSLAQGMPAASPPREKTATPGNTTPQLPAILPGNGPAQYDFFYAGEAGNNRQMFLVKKGEIAWSYDDRTGKGEISDAVLLSNGNILFAHQFGVTEITPEKKVVWNYDAPARHRNSHRPTHRKGACPLHSKWRSGIAESR